MLNHLRIASICFLLGLANSALAQSLPGSQLPEATSSAPAAGGGELEELYDKDDAKPKSDSKTEKPSAEKVNQVKREIPDAQNLSDLAKLAPFSDVAVIQRRFLPKTNRFEASANIFTNLNNPFFSSYGVGVSLAYYIRERYAIEALADISTSSSREVTDDLAHNRNITTTNLVTSNAFYGAALKWNPIYGKMTWLNKTIVPFDLNFSLGGGMTTTTDNQSVPTLHVGSSQVFAINKSMAVRWEFTWNMYQADAIDQSNQSVRITQNDLFLGIGMSFYFPEASYR